MSGDALGQSPKEPQGKNTTLMAAITLEGAMGESMTIEGATDSEAFEAALGALPGPISF